MTQEALKLALDFVETVHVGEWVGSIERQLEVITAVKKALAQTQEPNIQASIRRTSMGGLVGQVLWIDNKLAEGDYNLHTAPPQRTWQGLTDEDRQAAFESMPDMLDGFLKTWGWLHFSKAIEAKLKEKNT